MTKNIYFAGGCFWGVQKYFSLIPGVESTCAGYANGKTEQTTYEDVCRGKTGHAETVKVTYDPQKTTLGLLLEMFYQTIDPTSVNRQGNDTGPQYRSGIFYIDPADIPVINDSLKLLQKGYDRPLAIAVEPLRNFCPAEEVHQKYLDKNPSGYCHIGAEKFTQAKKAAPFRYAQAPHEERLKKLTPIQYEVTQNAATEPPFQNEYYDHFSEGIYVDLITGEPLFLSCDKFDAGCGWPSFAKPVSPSVMKESRDRSFGMERTEVRSNKSGAHLGHVFCDGPKERGGLRYCINSAALRFIPKEQMELEGYSEFLPLL